MVTYLILASIILSVLLCRGLFGPFSRLTTFHVFVIAFVVLQSVGTLRLVDQGNDTFFLLQILTMPVVLIAGKGAMLVSGRTWIPTTADERAAAAYSATPISMFVRHRGPLIVLGLVGICIMFVVDRGTDSIALFYTIFNPGDRLTSMNLRLTHFTSRFGGLAAMFYSYSKTIFIPFFMSLVYALNRQKVLSKGWMILGVCSSLFFVALSLEKAPLAYMATLIAIVHHLTGRGLNAKVVAFAFLGVVVLPAAVYPLLDYGKFDASIFAYMSDNFMRRVFDVNAGGSLFYTQVFPSSYDFSGWSSNRILAAIAGVEFVNRPQKLASILFGDHYVSSGSYPAGFHISFYADWGLGLSFLFIASAGAAIGYSETLIRRYLRGVVGVAVRAVVLLAVATLMISDFYSVALGRGLISLPFAAVIFADLVPARMRPKAQSMSENLTYSR